MTNSKEVFVDVSLTVNLGNYESAKVSMGETLVLGTNDDPTSARDSLFQMLVKECKLKASMFKDFYNNGGEHKIPEFKKGSDILTDPVDHVDDVTISDTHTSDKPADKDMANALVEKVKGVKWIWAKIIYPYYEKHDIDTKATKLWELPADDIQALNYQVDEALEADVGRSV